jgi:hypothetical protein
LVATSPGIEEPPVQHGRLVGCAEARWRSEARRMSPKSRDGVGSAPALTGFEHECRAGKR